MIFRFNKKKLSDVVKVQQFLEKEGIDFELLVDQLDLQVGEVAEAIAPTPLPGQEPPTTNEQRYGWTPAEHDGGMCMKQDCDNPFHY